MCVLKLSTGKTTTLDVSDVLNIKIFLMNIWGPFWPIWLLAISGIAIWLLAYMVSGLRFAPFMAHGVQHHHL